MQRIGVPWLGYTCVCPYCRSGRENLCDRPLFTGYTRDGGYATHTPPHATASRFRSARDDAEIAVPMRRPDRLAQLDGGRGGGGSAASRRSASTASAPPRISWRRWPRPASGRSPAVATPRRRHLRDRSARVGRQLGRDAAGAARRRHHLRPVGALVPAAKKAVVCGGIHMSDIPVFPYRLLWEERHIVSVASLTARMRASSWRWQDRRGEERGHALSGRSQRGTPICASRLQAAARFL